MRSAIQTYSSGNFNAATIVAGINSLEITFAAVLYFLVDPPRAGCDERLVRFASTLNPKRIVYISCNPKTLARDVVLFREMGYDTDTVYPFDLFPMTGHVESLVCLTKQTN